MTNTNNEPVTLGNWMLTYLLLVIPIVGFIMLFVWAFSSNTPASKSNWAKAMLIWGLIGIVFYMVLFMMMGLGASVMSQ